MVECSHISKNYGSFVALRDVSLHIKAGTLTALLGANGAGKTTLMRILSGITDGYQGQIRLGTPSVGYLPEERGLFRDQCVSDQLVFFAMQHGMARREARQQVDMWLERLGAAMWSKKRVGQLSKGMAQKVQFIAAVAHNPRLLLLDEPMSGLDPLLAESISEIIQDLHRAGTTIIFSTHNLYDAAKLSDHYTVLSRGSLRYCGPAEAVTREQIMAML